MLLKGWDLEHFFEGKISFPGRKVTQEKKAVFCSFSLTPWSFIVINASNTIVETPPVTCF